jgi:hypothetical protein
MARGEEGNHRRGAEGTKEITKTQREKESTSPFVRGCLWGKV